ncbi:hypothetical protein LZ554_006228 [Drepanopeziza brunnea f. sp. 'monogermtubi']|nr:hypothetical protein LZ554_006228 [Drepanopeziza brunnea f. sp. 'monogermtubi']
MSIDIRAALGRRASGPFKAQGAVLGGIPNATLDVPITVVFLMLFLIGGAFHFYTHEINRKRQHKFHLSALMFDFCLVRTITCTLRIVWTFKPDNNSLVLTAMIFENAGAVVLFAVNVIFTQRIIRALHPDFGWKPFLNTFFLFIISSVPFIIVHNIIFTVVSSYSQSAVVQNVVHGFLLFGLSYSLILSIIPILFIVPALVMPRSIPIERFAHGRFRSKIVILLVSTVLLFAGAIVRLISAVLKNPASKPGAIESKSIFYIIGFTSEIIVVVLYAVLRIDRRFWVPDGATGPGDYSRVQRGEGEKSYQDLKSPYGHYSAYMDTSSACGSPKTPGRESQAWFGEANLITKPTREEVRTVIHSLGFPAETVGMPMDCGDGEEILLYAFRVKKLAREQKPKMVLRQSGRNSYWSVDTACEQQSMM